MRKRAGLNQAQLADATGISQSAISHLENGTRPLTLAWMRSFGRALDCSPADLLDDTDNPDRLDDGERRLVGRYRAAAESEREVIERVTDAVVPYPRDLDRDRAA